MKKPLYCHYLNIIESHDMPRPMYLIKEPMLNILMQEADIGVPVASLVKKYSLIVTPPTLSKMIRHYKSALECTDTTSKEIILKSLFPDWLDGDKTIIKQPSIYAYSGSFPLGKWIRR